jgi:thiol-disulfide isomerase/thioredoxin
MRNLLLAVLLAVFAITACGQNKSETATPSPSGGESFHLQTLEGRAVTLKDFKGKVLILDIWDTWCPPCRKEIPHFIDLYSSYKGKGVEILGAAIGREGRDKVVDFIRQNKVNYPNVLASEELLNTYGPIQGIPTTLVIDQKGGIYKKYVGYQDQEVFENDIKALLERS